MEGQQDTLIVKLRVAAWACKRRLILIAVTSLVFLSLLVIAFGIAVPNREYYQQNVKLFLPQNGPGIYCYPNGQEFSPNDVISPEVLHKVYADCGLRDFIKFEDFSKLFSFTSIVMKKQFLDEKFAKALQRRNITSAEIKTLEDQYEEELAKLDQEDFCLSFRKSLTVPARTAANIPLMTVQTWKEIYQQQNGRLPQSASAKDLEQELSKDLQASPLIAVDRAMFYNGKMMEFSQAMMKILGTRRLTLPDTGEALEDIVDRLERIKTCQLDVLMQMVVEDQSIQGQFSELFLSGKISSLSKSLSEAEGSLNCIDGALAKISKNGTAPASAASGSKSDETHINIDSSFFSQLSSLIRSDITNKSRERLAEQYKNQGIKAAKLRAELEYYTKLNEQMLKGKTQKSGMALFKTQFNDAVKELVRTEKQLEQFKALVAENGLSDFRFYLPTHPTYRTQAMSISWGTLVTIAFVLWLLINFCSVSFVLLRMMSKEN